MNFLVKLQSCKLPDELAWSLKHFYESYRQALQKNGQDIGDHEAVLLDFVTLVEKQLKAPYRFEPYHKAILEPYDYYRFGLELMRPLVDFSRSSIEGIENLEEIVVKLKAKENVILLANHQTEPDPQAMSLLLESRYPDLAREMIFVAGHRVVSDPLAVPFSMGRNLLCIFSKKYVEAPPELKVEKLEHNRKTMLMMRELLSEGGHCIYVAPSGGRDRPNHLGKIEVAPFDAQSIEMFWLMAQQAKTATHFYPLALSTYKLLPPPASIADELGEQRYTQCTPLHMAFGREVPMVDFPGKVAGDRQLNRQRRAEYIEGQVKHMYDAFSVDY